MNKICFALFGPWLYRIFLKLGKLFYNKIAVHSSGKASHFASTEWDMVQSMNEYLEEEEFITNDKPKDD